jgi:cytochrome P450
VRDLQRDARLRQPGIRMLERQGVHDGPVYERFARSLISLDGPEHTRLRRLVAKAFTPRAVDRLRPMMRSWIGERADAFAGRGGGDVIAEVVDAYPIAVICELVGAPADDWPRFSTWATDIFRLFQRNLAEDLPSSTPPRSTCATTPPT